MTNDDHQIVRCQCSAKLRVPAAAAGRKVKCPKCGFKILVGAPTSASSATPQPANTAPPPVPSSPPMEEDNLLDDLLSSEASSETAQGPDLLAHQKTCPKCKAQMTKDAKVCLSCGFDPAIVGNEPAKKSIATSKVGGLAKGASRFGIGCALSAGGALIGAGVWYFVLMSTGWEHGLIAWGVGLLAGLGMKIGYGQENMRGAMVAMAMALMGILVAKGMVYNVAKEALGQLEKMWDPSTAEVIWRDQLQCESELDVQGLSPWDPGRIRCENASQELMKKSKSEIESRRDDLDFWYETERWKDDVYAKNHLACLYAQENPLVYNAILSEEDWEEGDSIVRPKWEPIFEKALARVEGMPSDQWPVEARTIEDDRLEGLKDELADLKSEIDDDISGPFGSRKFTFFSMFGPIDLIFILLALGTAIKLGGGQED